MFLLRPSLWLPLYMLARSASGVISFSALQPCGLVVSLQVSMTYPLIRDVFSLATHVAGGQQFSRWSICKHLSMGQCQVVCTSVTWGGFWNFFIRMQPQVFLPCSLIGTGCTLASPWAALLSFSDSAFPPSQGCLNFTHCLWGNAGVVGRAVDLHTKGPFSPL